MNQPPYQPGQYQPGQSQPSYPSTNYSPQGYQQQPPQGYPPYQQPYQQPQYPPMQQPVQPPPKKKANKLLIGCLGAVVLLLVIIIAAAASHGSSSNTGTLSTGNTPGNVTPTQASTTNNQHFKVGDTVTVGSDWKAVVNSVKTDDGGQYSALKTGNTFVVVDISLTNLSGKEQNISSALNFTLQDSTGQKYTEGIDTNTGATPDGKVAAGSILRGSIAYEVPATQKSFTFAFEPNILSSGQTIWDLSI